jgi:hypothetical protein
MLNNPFMWNPGPIIAGASNVALPSNPVYTVADFYEVYPQFQGQVPDFLMTQFLAMANATVLESRWHENWIFGTSLFIAHWCVTYMESTAGCNPTASSIIAAAKTKGLQTSKAAGDISVSYDFSKTNFEGWPQYQTTTFGTQFASMARLLGMAGMFIW